MSGICLWFSEGIDPAQAKLIFGLMRTRLPLDEPRMVLRRGAGGQEQFIQLVMGWEIWVAAFGAIAAGFLAKLGQRAADGSWDFVRNRLRGSDVKPLRDIAEALASVRCSDGTAPRLVIGLNIPDDYFGTVITIESTDSVEIAYIIVEFVSIAEKISLSMIDEIKASHVPLGRANVSMLKDGSFRIYWLT